MSGRRNSVLTFLYQAHKQQLLQCLCTGLAVDFIVILQSFNIFLWLFRAHFGQELFLCINLNGKLIRSPGFISVVRIKDGLLIFHHFFFLEVQRREVENLSFALTLSSRSFLQTSSSTASMLLLLFIFSCLHSSLSFFDSFN